MEIYIDGDGNEVTVQSLKDMFGDDWETEAANLGYSKKAEGVVAEDATVTPITPVASENMESNSENSSSELNVDEWEVVLPSKTEVVVPEDRKYTDIIEIPDFKSQDTQDLVNAYNTLYGGENGGFSFTKRGSSRIGIEALNGNRIEVALNPEYYTGPSLPGGGISTTSLALRLGQAVGLIDKPTHTGD